MFICISIFFGSNPCQRRQDWSGPTNGRARRQIGGIGAENSGFYNGPQGLDSLGDSDKLSMSLHGIIVETESRLARRRNGSLNEPVNAVGCDAIGLDTGRDGMFDVTRRQALALGGTGILSAASVQRRGGRAERQGQAHDRLSTSTFPPSIRRSGPRRSIRRSRRSTASIFDQPVGQKPDLSFTPGLPDRLGMERRQDEGLDGCARGRRLARRVALHAGRRCVAEGWSLERAGDLKTGNPIQFVWGTTGNFKIDGHRITADVKSVRPGPFQMDGVSHRLRPAQGAITRRSAPKASKRSRSALARTWSTSIRAMRSCGSRQPEYWGGKPALRDGDFQVRARPHDPRRRDRKPARPM